MMCQAHHLAKAKVTRAKDLLFQNVVMLHIKVKEMKRTTTYQQKVNTFFLKVAILISNQVEGWSCKYHGHLVMGS